MVVPVFNGLGGEIAPFASRYLFLSKPKNLIKNNYNTQLVNAVHCTQGCNHRWQKKLCWSDQYFPFKMLVYIYTFMKGEYSTTWSQVYYMVLARIFYDVCKVSRMRRQDSSLVQENMIIYHSCVARSSLVTSATKDKIKIVTLMYQSPKSLL